MLCLPYCSSDDNGGGSGNGGGGETPTDTETPCTPSRTKLFPTGPSSASLTVGLCHGAGGLIDYGFGFLACDNTMGVLSDTTGFSLDGTEYTIRALAIRHYTSSGGHRSLIIWLSAGSHPLNNLILLIGDKEFRFEGHHATPVGLYHWGDTLGLIWSGGDTVNDIQIIEEITCP